MRRGSVVQACLPSRMVGGGQAERFSDCLYRLGALAWVGHIRNPSGSRRPVLCDGPGCQDGESPSSMPRNAERFWPTSEARPSAASVDERGHRS